MSKQQIGVVGMAVMGRNLALNIESRGYSVSIFNRSREKPMKSSQRIRARSWFHITPSRSLSAPWKNRAVSC